MEKKANTYTVVLEDLVSMGARCSSRKEITFTDKQKAWDYFDEMAVGGEWNMCTMYENMGKEDQECLDYVEERK